MRGTIRKISNAAQWNMPATIDDINNIVAIENAVGKWKAANGYAC